MHSVSKFEKRSYSFTHKSKVNMTIQKKSTRPSRTSRLLNIKEFAKIFNDKYIETSLCRIPHARIGFVPGDGKCFTASICAILVRSNISDLHEKLKNIVKQERPCGIDHDVEALIPEIDALAMVASNHLRINIHLHAPKIETQIYFPKTTSTFENPKNVHIYVLRGHCFPVYV